MLIQTYQEPQVTELLARGETYAGREEFVEPDFVEPYQWMREQLSEKVGRPLENYPVWGWARPRARVSDVCRGISADCREGWCSHLRHEDVDLLEVEVDAGEVLASCEVTWTYYGLNRWYLPGEEELRELEAAMRRGEEVESDFERRVRERLGITGVGNAPVTWPGEFQEEVEESWKRMLVPPEWEGDDRFGFTYPGRGPWVQVVTPEIRPAQVRRVRPFRTMDEVKTVGKWERWRVGDRE